MSASGTPRRVLSLAAGLTALAACGHAPEPPAVADAGLPGQTVYCYITIADDDCYAAPQPGQDARLIRAWPPIQ